MSRQIVIPAREHGVIRVFSLNLPVAQVETMLAEAPAAAHLLLGLATIDTTHTEIFPVSDLAGLGLAGYLIEGQGIAADQIAPDRARLNALDGYVMIVRSLAFGGAAATLSPGPALTLIGRYDETRPTAATLTPATAPTGEATTGAPSARKPVSDAAMSGRVATVVLLILFALVAVMVGLS